MSGAVLRALPNELSFNNHNNAMRWVIHLIKNLWICKVKQFVQGYTVGNAITGIKMQVFLTLKFGPFHWSSFLLKQSP